MPKSSSPKRLYVRFVEKDTKFSIGEYINGKWNNVCEPFKITDMKSLASFIGDVRIFKRKTSREVEYEGYCGSKAAELLVNEIKRLEAS
jgi:hypothetical protein